MALKPLSRSVSIIGVGATQFGTPFDTPEFPGHGRMGCFGRISGCRR